MHKIEYLEIEPNSNYEKIISKVLEKCFETENLSKDNLLVSIVLTTPDNIRRINKEYRNIDKPTDVLSFPMFQRDEIQELIKKNYEVEDVLGDIIISIPRVKEQAIEYNHSFERELAYMVVHGFYHLMGYDHMEETEKKEMRKKEDEVLNKLGITRD